MRKHLSVVMLLARSTIYPILILLAGMAAGQIALFLARFSDACTAADAGISMRGFETLFGEGLLPWLFGAVFLAVTILLCSTGCGFGSRTDYTIGRLQIGERCVFWWQGGLQRGNLSAALGG